MVQNIPNGLWPTMLTPFTNDGKVDFASLAHLIEWYVNKRADGLFAVCQSSEMFYLSLSERIDIAEFVVRQAAGRVPVIASGHISDSFEDQVRELNAIAETGVDAVVLVTNRMASPEESDEVWMDRTLKLIQKIPANTALGFYECPWPYKRVLSPKLLKQCAETNRFHFLKDTSCDIENLTGKITAVKGTGLKVFNANSATLLDSLRAGANGYSGVMANFQPELYRWLLDHWQDGGERVEEISAFLSLSSQIERQLYPVNAKYSLHRAGILGSTVCRTADNTKLTASLRLEVEQLNRLTHVYNQKYKV